MQWKCIKYLTTDLYIHLSAFTITGQATLIYPLSGFRRNAFRESPLKWDIVPGFLIKQTLSTY